MIKIVSTKQMQDFDAYTIKTEIPSKELMYRAAKGIFDAYDYTSKKVYIICGSGNNGGDGLALANIMLDCGIEPYVYLIKDELKEDPAYYLNKLREKNYTNIFNINDCDYLADVIVDCIFGTGFLYDVKEPIKSVIENINNSNAYVISADISSGLNSTNGIAKCAVKADLTVAIQFYKYGHFLNDGKDFSKSFTSVDIGIKDREDVAYIIEDSDIIFDKRKFNVSKFDFGQSLIIGGCKNFAGAIKLANMGVSALRSGAGLNTIASIKALEDVIKMHIVESTFFALEEENGYIKFNEETLFKLISNKDAIALGMGLGSSWEENKKVIDYIIKNSNKKVLLDADGINTYKGKYFDLIDKKCELILTPHIKEFARLINISEEEILKNPVSYAKEFAKKINATILLKGPSTIITNGDKIYLVINGSAALSKGGSGDTLAGVILGFLAQGFEPIKACAYGAYLCAKAAKNAAEIYSEYGTLASDVAKEISKLIKY